MLQCNPNALHNYAYHKQFTSNAMLIKFLLHNNAYRSNTILMHCIIMLIISKFISNALLLLCTTMLS